jgi:PAS domain S-box-containing protein
MTVPFRRRFSTKLVLLISIVFLIPVVTSIAMLVATSQASVDLFEKVLTEPPGKQQLFLQEMLPQSDHGYAGASGVIALLRDYEHRRSFGLASSLIVISLALAAVVILLSMLLLKRGMVSLRELSAAAAAVGGGDFDVSPVAHSDDEFANLTEAFGLMTRRLRETMVSRDFMNHVIESMPAAIFTVDAKHRITTWNRQAARLTGIPSSEALGREAGELADVIARLPEDAAIPFFGKEAVMRPRGGGQRIVSIGADFLFAHTGERAGLIVTFVDMSEQKELERELLIAKERAEESSRLRSEFLANMSHEIRTPLNGIMGLAEVLAEGEGDAERRQHLGTIRQCGENLLYLINEILDLSKLEAGKMVLHRTTAVTADLLREAVATVEVGCKRKGIALATDVAPGVPEMIEVDHRKLVQILINLLGNALKFTDQGSIRLIVAPYRGERRGTLLFSVADTGLGIAADRQAHIFESFIQSEEHLTRRSEGTGLGLAIAGKLIGLMGGEIWVESNLGTGSTFSFTIAH